MGDLHILTKKEEQEEAEPISCEVCSQWDTLSAHWLLYSDGSMRCITCGTPYDLVDVDTQEESK